MTVNKNHGRAIKSESQGQEYWADLVKESQGSNLSKRDFCKEKGIPVSAYYYWKKRLPEILPSTKAPFVEISRFLQNSAITGNDDIFSFSISHDLQLHVAADLKTILPLIQSLIGKSK
jgi:hypothetical protein